VLAAFAIFCGIVLTATPAKPEVTLGEPIELRLTATNAGPEERTGTALVLDERSVELQVEYRIAYHGVSPTGAPGVHLLFQYDRTLEKEPATETFKSRDSRTGAIAFTPVAAGPHKLEARYGGIRAAPVEVNVLPAAGGATALGWKLETTRGAMTVRFLPEAAPNHVAHFAELARTGFFNGLGFHRVIKGFMAQGGDPLGTGEGGPGYSLPEEFSRKAQPPHKLGTVSTARDEDPDTGGSQFFICFADVPRLDHKYTVFGEVADGLDVLKKIEEAAGLPKDERNGMPPAELVKITKSTLVPLGKQ
jgi:peptidylprolyl isomerase